MRLYVTNCTPQRQLFCYRLDFVPPGQKADKGDQQAFKRVEFRRGQQLPVGPDLPAEQLSPLIAQLEKFGAIAELDVPNRLRNEVHPFVWNLGTSVKRNKAQEVVKHNRRVLQGLGVERRKLAAVAGNEAIGKVVELNVGLNPTQHVEVAIEQMSAPGEGDLGSRLDEGYRVVPDGSDGAPPVARRGGGRGSRRRAA